MRTKLEVIADVAMLSPQELLILLRVLEHEISLDPKLRTRFIEYKYNNYAVARHIGHLYLSAHTHCDSGTVQAIDEALNLFYQKA
jgi:hypothetical protein